MTDLVPEFGGPEVAEALAAALLAVDDDVVPRLLVDVERGRAPREVVGATYDPGSNALVLRTEPLGRVGPRDAWLERAIHDELRRRRDPPRDLNITYRSDRGRR